MSVEPLGNVGPAALLFHTGLVAVLRPGADPQEVLEALRAHPGVLWAELAHGTDPAELHRQAEELAILQEEIWREIHSAVRGEPA